MDISAERMDLDSFARKAVKNYWVVSDEGGGGEPQQFLAIIGAWLAIWCVVAELRWLKPHSTFF